MSRKRHFRSPKRKTEPTFIDLNIPQTVGKFTSETITRHKTRIFSKPSNSPIFKNMVFQNNTYWNFRNTFHISWHFFSGRWLRTVVACSSSNGHGSSLRLQGPILQVRLPHCNIYYRGWCWFKLIVRFPEPLGEADKMLIRIWVSRPKWDWLQSPPRI